VRLIAKDEIQSWKLADELKKDKELRKVLRALTSHYTTESTEAARSCGLPLYNDEADVPMRDATSVSSWWRRTWPSSTWTVV
jgi:HEPN domain-containing protein